MAVLEIGWGYVADNYEAVMEAIKNDWPFSLCGHEPGSHYAQLWEDAADAEAMKHDFNDYDPLEDEWYDD